MDNIILYLLNIIQAQQKQISWLLLFISKYIPLKQWAFDDSRSPKYEKFKVDKLPVIIKFEKQDYRFLLDYTRHVEVFFSTQSLSNPVNFSGYLVSK